MLLTVALVTPSRLARSTARASPVRVDQIGDQLDIVLGDLVAMIAARAAEAFGLLVRLGQAASVLATCHRVPPGRSPTAAARPAGSTGTSRAHGRQRAGLPTVACHA